MLYSLFKRLFFLTVKGYFRTIHIEGLSHIPDAGPVILVANHTSAFMDPILLATHIKRPVYFLARGESFKSKLVSIIFGWLHMIPIYRPDVTPDEVHKNQQIFKRCFDHLANGKMMLVFPEGFSKTERRLRPIKTGTARIVLGAEGQHEFKLGVRIVPIGVNYSNPHYFQSEVYVKVGEAIQVNDLANIYEKDQVKAVHELTEMIRSRLEHLTVVIKDLSLNQFVVDIERLLKSITADSDGAEHQLAKEFYLTKETVSVVNYFKSVRPVEAMEFQNRISRYFDLVDELGIGNVELNQKSEGSSDTGVGLLLIFGSPVFIYGCLVNLLPFWTSKTLSRKIIVRKDFIGSMKLAFGMFIFLIFYLIAAVFLSAIIGWFWALMAVVSFYLTGLFSVHYLNVYFSWHSRKKFIRFFRSNKMLLKKLQLRRKKLLARLEEGYKLYSEAHQRH